MGLIRLLFLIAVLVAVAVVLRDVLKRLGTYIDGQKDIDGGGRPARPRLLALQRGPHEVLGLQPGASRLEIERAWRRILAENDAEKVAGLSPSVQELAARLRQEATDARDSLVKQEEEDA